MEGTGREGREGRGGEGKEIGGEGRGQTSREVS